MKIGSGGAFNIPDVGGGNGAFSFGGGAGAQILYCADVEKTRFPIIRKTQAPPPPREVRRKVAQFRRIKKDLAVHIRETLVVLDYVLRAILPPIEKFNEGGERFLYTAAVF